MSGGSKHDIQKERPIEQQRGGYTGKILDNTVEVRYQTKPNLVSKKDVDYIDVATNQAYSIATSMIPFLNHDDANRALMGSNMQKQTIACVRPQAPLVATGIEERAARDSGRLILAKEAGEVTYVDARMIKVKNKSGKTDEYDIVAFSRTNSFTAFLIIFCLSGVPIMLAWK